MEANPKYIRKLTNVLGLEEAKPMMTPSLKRTPTTESLVSWKAKDEQCIEQLWENCCTCARSEQTSCTA